MKFFLQRPGFTLIELMLMVAIVGLLSAVAIPKMAQLVAKSQASTTKGNLGVLRSVLSIYYSENEGNYPVDTLNCLTVGSKYLTNIPSANLPAMPGLNAGHTTSNFVTPSGLFSLLFLLDIGGWGYENNPAGTPSVLSPPDIVPWGIVVVNCFHKDPSGQLWAFN